MISTVSDLELVWNRKYITEHIQGLFWKHFVADTWTHHVGSDVQRVGISCWMSRCTWKTNKQGWCEICWCCCSSAADSWGLGLWTFPQAFEGTSEEVFKMHSSDDWPCSSLTRYKTAYMLTWWIAYLKQSFLLFLFKLIFKLPWRQKNLKTYALESGSDF